MDVDEIGGTNPVTLIDVHGWTDCGARLLLICGYQYTHSMMKKEPDDGKPLPVTQE